MVFGGKKNGPTICCLSQFFVEGFLKFSCCLHVCWRIYFVSFKIMHKVSIFKFGNLLTVNKESLIIKTKIVICKMYWEYTVHVFLKNKECFNKNITLKIAIKLCIIIISKIMQKYVWSLYCHQYWPINFLKLNCRQHYSM